MTIGTHKTSTFFDNGYRTCIYHQTAVCKANSREVILRSGGWETATTKKRINQCFREWGIPCHLYQDNFIWYVETPQGIKPFEDGMVIPL